MKKSRVTRILAIALFTICAVIARADDGSWSTSFREAAGPIYAETPNVDIALDSELLRFSMRPEGVTEAVFLFRNTADHEVRVEAGFPIKVGLSGARLLTDSNEGEPSRILYLRKGRNEPEARGFLEARAFFGDASSGASGVLTIPYDAAAVRRKVDRKDFEDPFAFSITQDGAPIAWDWVLLESKVLEPGSARLELGFHFHHVLTFKPNSASVVRVTYSQDVLRGAESGGVRTTSYYGWDYVLGTGGTWKGSIGKLLVCVPADAEVSLPEAFAQLGIQGAEKVFLARNYKPAEDDTASLSRSVAGSTWPGYMEQLWFGKDIVSAQMPSTPAQDFVNVKGASSSLPDKVTIYTPEGLIKDMDFKPLRLFDGILESAWAESAQGDGIGEWVEIELTRDVAGFQVQNGFSMSFTPVKGTTIDTYFGKNNRVRTLEINSRNSGFSETIDLEDSNEHPQYFPLALPRGIYRFVIRSVYKGSKWSDTCLGEIIFLPASEAVTKLLAEDAFLKSSF
jgi:hypothetical protein